MNEIIIQRLAETDVDGFAEAYRLYHDAIELSEQRPEGEFRGLALRPDYRFLVARLGERTVGLSVSYVPSEDYFWLFEYAAVAPDMRGASIGAQLFRASQMIAGDHRTPLIEVDADRGEAEQARRLNFYRRLGCKRISGLDYLLPLEAFGKPPPMWMLALPQAGVTAIDIDTLERWLRSIYEDVYGQRLDDPRLARMIDPLPDAVALEPI